MFYGFDEKQYEDLKLPQSFRVHHSFNCNSKISLDWTFFPFFNISLCWINGYDKGMKMLMLMKNEFGFWVYNEHRTSFDIIISNNSYNCAEWSDKYRFLIRCSLLTRWQNSFFMNVVSFSSAEITRRHEVNQFWCCEACRVLYHFAICQM